jgi:biotin carboxyl carrier protein
MATVTPPGTTDGDGRASLADARRDAVRVTAAPSSADLGLHPATIVPVAAEPPLRHGRASIEWVPDGHADRALLEIVAPGEGRLRYAHVEPRASDAGARSTAESTSGDVEVQRVTWSEVAAPGARSGIRRLEVVVDGWRFEFDVESEARARLMERARRDRGAATGAGAAEVRAMIPGRVLDVAVAAGDAVGIGQRVLVIEAMKMQNELRAPRAGVVTDVRVAAGQTVELGDLLLVIGDAPVSPAPDGPGSTAGTAPTAPDNAGA